jgi:uncharacterized membrane protein YbhN (UPF0104 family)
MTEAHAPEEIEANAQPTRRWKSVLRQVLPWVGTLLILGYLGATQDLDAVWEALTKARFDWLLPLWVATVFAVFWFDTGCLVVLFSRLNARVGFRELLPVKGASYFLNVINYNAAAGGIAWFLKMRAGVRFLEAASSMLLLNVLDLIVLNLFVSAGLLIGGSAMDPAVRAAIVPVHIGLYVLYAGALVYWNGKVDFLVMGRLRPLAIFSSFAKARLADHGLLLALRSGFIFIYVGMQFVTLHIFDIQVPFGELLVFNSIITLVGTIPISIAGLGTTQLLMLEFYAPYGTQGQILAYSTAVIFMFAVARMLIGYWYLGEMTRSIAKGAPEAAPPAPHAP